MLSCQDCSPPSRPCQWHDEHVVAQSSVIVAAARTPIGTAGGALADLVAHDLAAPVLASVYADLGLLDEVFLGNCMGPGGNVARVACLAAGLGEGVPALTVDRQCASGLAAIVAGADAAVARGGTVIAGGVESASTAPWRMWPAIDGGEPQRYAKAPFAPAGWADPDMGRAAEDIARLRGISRQRQDEYAARSHERAVESQRSGAFETEIIPVAGLAQDERPRAGFTAERISRFPPAFAEGGSVTAANSCGINDGAAAVAVVPDDGRRNLSGLRVLSSVTVGVDPALPGLAIVPAVRKALALAGTSIADLDVIEFNEAFASQILACCDELGIDDARVCLQGGALALGHPWGASGAILAVRLLSQLVHQDAGRLGLAAIAAGGGQGVAMVVERCR